MNENIILAELKNTILSKVDDKSDVSNWIKINPKNQKVESLSFISSSEEMVNGNLINVREFSKGELRFDNNFAKFQYNQEGHILMNCNTLEIPEVILDKIEVFLTK